MKLHELKPAPGSRHRRIRVGRGIAAGKGKTAGRGTKGQKSRSGGKVPPWFEGGQTPIHVRVPKLRGFKRRDRIEYQVVNIGRISEYAAAGRFGADPGGKDPLTINAEVLAAAGLIARPADPVKVLGDGDIDIKVFVAADAFTASARSKIEGAGGFVQVTAPEKAPATDGEPEGGDEPEAEIAASPSTSEEAQPATEPESPQEEAPVQAEAASDDDASASDDDDAKATE